jgi:protein-tyrosine phosphatase
LDELEAHIDEIVFPVVVKGKSEIIKAPPFYANNKDQLLEKIAVWGKHLNSFNVTFPIIQQFIDGIGLGFFALYKDGVCKRVFMHRRIREAPPSGGPSTCALSIYEEDLMQAGKKILDALAWHGVAMVEFKRERSTGDLYLIEINPKFWGSLDLALASGVNFPALDVRIAMSEEIQFSDEYKVGLKYHWPLDGEIEHIKKNYSAISPVLADCIDPRVKSNIWLSDPLPSLYSLNSLIRRVFAWLINRIGLGKLAYRIKRIGFKNTFIRYYTESTGIPILKYSRITDMIYVGAQHSVAGLRKLMENGIKTIVNMRSEFDDRHHDLILDDYCYLPVVEFTAPELSELEEGIGFIKTKVEQGRKVYIHCSEGISRAPTLAIAFLISTGVSFPEAVALVRKARPFINILPVQMECLSKFAAKVKNEVDEIQRNQG